MTAERIVVGEADVRDPVRVLFVVGQGLSSVIEEAVSGTGLDASYANSVLEALELLRAAKQESRPTDLVFSDIALTDGSIWGGLEIARAVREEELASLFVLLAEPGNGMTPWAMKREGIHQVVYGSSLINLRTAFGQAREAVLHPEPAPATI